MALLDPFESCAKAALLTSDVHPATEAMPDKNGEIWAGGLQSGRMWRSNAGTDQWTGHMMTEPYAHDRRPWIDNATDPVSVWFVDHNGYMVRSQTLD